MRWRHYGQEVTIPGFIVVSCLQDNRFPEPHNASQAKQPVVRWIHYSQEITIPGLTVYNITDSQYIVSQAVVCKLLNFDHTPKRNLNRCISNGCVAIILLRLLNTGPPVMEYYPLILRQNLVSGSVRVMKLLK